jgi:hypothetical protein
MVLCNITVREYSPKERMELKGTYVIKNDKIEEGKNYNGKDYLYGLWSRQ